MSCLVKQAVNTARLATEDEDEQRRIVDLTADYLKKVDLSRSPADISTRIYRIVSEVTGIIDPYADFKKRTNKEALALLPVMREVIESSEDPLLTALHVAVAGNIVDLGIGMEFNLIKDLEMALETAFAVDRFTL